MEADTIDTRPIAELIGWTMIDLGDRNAHRFHYRRPNGGISSIDRGPTVDELLQWLRSKGCSWSGGGNDVAAVWFEAFWKRGGGSFMPARSWDSLYEAAEYAVRRVAAHV